MAEAQDLLDGLRHELPVRPTTYVVPAATGLVIIDEVNGFCTVGAGNLAPQQPDAQIAGMVEETDRLAHAFRAHKLPVFAFLDTHQLGKPEPPYPPHCERGTGEENLVPKLRWLEDDPDVTLLRKDCINGFVGAIEPATARGMHAVHHNKIVDWVNAHRLEAIVTVGICTDICVMDFVLTMLSARNHGLMATLRDIVVYEPACATYDLPRAVVEEQGLPVGASHPKMPTHHMGFYFMASRGAVIADRLAGV